MTFDWNVYYYDYHNRIKNLNNQAQGVVKSDKFFPVFREDNQDMIFKPLSKTKPLSTPYFAYSEVFWSTIINKYFDDSTPIYRLAICENIDNEFESKYHHGTIVNSLEKTNENLINLYEVFRDNPDPKVNITDYINYCEKFYNYIDIFDSKLIKENKVLAESLAFQVLLSILKFDQNYHYENVLFRVSNNEVKELAPMIDHEFSTMFLYLDNLLMNKVRFNSAIKSLTASNNTSDIMELLWYESFAALSKNLDVIVSRYKNVTILFLERLKYFIKELKEESIILENNNYLTSFNSDNYKIGHALFKDKDPQRAYRLQNELEKYSPNITDISSIVYEETLISSQTLSSEIEKRLIKK